MSTTAEELKDELNTVTVNLSNIKNHINAIYYPLLWNQSRYLVLYGGAGSGKSRFAAQKMIYRCLTEKHRFLVAMKVANTLRGTAWQLVNDIVNEWGLNKLFSFNKTNLTIRMMNGSEIIFLGLDDPEKIKSIAGITSVWLEEPTALDIEDFEQVDLRLRGQSKHYKQIMLSFNPVVVTHWLKNYFFAKEKYTVSGPDGRYENAKVPIKVGDRIVNLTYTTTRTSYLDNVFIDEVYRAKLESYRTSNPNYYKIYCLGSWGSLTGVIYQQPTLINLSEFPREFAEQFYSVDFGFNAPSVLVEHRLKKKLSGFSDFAGTEVYERELIYQPKLTNTDFIKLTIQKLPENYLHLKTKPPIYCDNAEPDRIEEMKRAGLNAKPAYKGKNSVMDGIDFCKTLKIFLTNDSINANKEYLSYCWATDSDNNPLDAPMDSEDHYMDAKRYGQWTHIGKKANQGYFGGGFNVYD